MSAPRLARTDLLIALEKELDAAGYTYREKCGRKHGRILVDVEGREEPIFVSGTPSDHRAIKNAVGHLRRKIKSWRSETAAVIESQPMEEEVMTEIDEDVDGVMFQMIAPRKRDIEGEMIQTVNARDLHTFLKAGKDFSNWVKDRIEQYGFAENVDFVVFAEMGENPKGGRPAKEYAISIDMAKELSMVERNEQGRKARRYFIRCEKALQDRTLYEEMFLDTLQRFESGLIEMRGMLSAIQDGHTDMLTVPVWEQRTKKALEWDRHEFLPEILGGMKRVIANRQNWEKAGLLPMPYGEEYEYRTADELCRLIIDADMIHRRLTSWVTNQILVPQARQEGWPQRQTEVRARSQKPIILFPLIPARNFIQSKKIRSSIMAKNDILNRNDALAAKQVTMFPEVGVAK